MIPLIQNVLWHQDIKQDGVRYKVRQLYLYYADFGGSLNSVLIP